MSIYHGIRAARRALQQKADAPLRMAGVTGNGEGVIETGTLNLIYCVTAEEGVVQAWAYNCPHVYGLPVWLTRSERRPGALEVAAVRDIGSQGASRQAEVGNHGESHRWLGTRAEGGGYDPIFIELRQFMPFGIWAANDSNYAFTVQIGRGVIWTGAAFVELQTRLLDVSAAVPAPVSGTRQARFALVYVKSTNSGLGAEVATYPGTAKDYNLLSLADIPTPPADTLLVIGAVRLYSDQAMIQDGRANTDVIDLRFPVRALLDAGDIGAGQISTDRFSAYADLTAESKIGTGAAQVAAGNHAHAFTSLTDAPASYSGSAGKAAVVKNDESGLEFGTISKSFLELTDTPNDYAGQGGKTVTVKADESGLDFTLKGLTRDTFPVAVNAVTPHYDLTSPTSGLDLGVYYNGVRVLDADFGIDGDGGGFTLAFDVKAGDYVMAEHFTNVMQAIQLPTLAYPITRAHTTDKLDGIFGYIGTRGGFSMHHNPALETAWTPAYYTATQSSTWSIGAADKATDGDYSDAGASHTTNEIGAWWKADFGAGHTMTLTHFGMIGRLTSGYHPRNFTVQGSNDDSAWNDLLVVTGDGPDGGTWYSAAVAGAGAYRFIRILETGVNAHGDYYLVIGELEFWGTLT